MHYIPQQNQAGNEGRCRIKENDLVEHISFPKDIYKIKWKPPAIMLHCITVTVFMCFPFLSCRKMASTAVGQVLLARHKIFTAWKYYNWMWQFLQSFQWDAKQAVYKEELTTSAGPQQNYFPIGILEGPFLFFFLCSWTVSPCGENYY